MLWASRYDPSADANFNTITLYQTDDTTPSFSIDDSGNLTLTGTVDGVDVASLGTSSHAALTVSGTPDYVTLVGQDLVRAQIDLATDITGAVPVLNGGTGATTAGDARTNLGVDAAGTDNSTDVTLAGTPDYITLVGQVLTRNLVDLGTDITGTTIATSISDFDTEVSNNVSVAANTTHITSDGSDHSFIDQAVTGAATPAFAGLTFNGAASFADPGTSANSWKLTFVADNATVAQTGSIQTIFGADPYLRISAPDNSGVETTVLDIHDDAVIPSVASIDIGSSGSKFQDLFIAGNMTVDGTVDGIDIATDVAANTAKATNVSTALSTGTVNATTYGITSDGGTDDVVLVEADTTNAGLLGSDKWDEIVANNAKVTNVSTTLSVGTVGVNTVAITSDGGADDVTIPAATVSAAGLFTTAKWGEVVANNAKASNVSTALSAGTVNATTYGITSDGGADDIVLPEADTTNAGLLGADKWDEIVANTLKVSADGTVASHSDVSAAQATAIGNLSGTNSGDQTTIAGITGTTAQFNTALTDGSFTTGGGTATGTNTGDQTTIVGITGTAAQFNTAITDVTFSGSNTGDQTSIAGITGTTAQFNTALTDGSFATGGGTASGTNTGDQTTIVGITGTVAQFNTAITDATLSGSNTGDQTSIAGITGTTAQFNTALSDGSFATGGGTATGSNTGDEIAATTSAAGIVELALTTEATTGTSTTLAVTPDALEDKLYGTGFTGTTLSDNALLKTLLQELETAVEAAAVITTEASGSTTVGDGVTFTSAAITISAGQRAWVAVTVVEETAVNIHEGKVGSAANGDMVYWIRKTTGTDQSVFEIENNVGSAIDIEWAVFSIAP